MFDVQSALLAILLTYTQDEDEVDALVAIMPYLTPTGIDHEKLHSVCVPLGYEDDDVS